MPSVRLDTVEGYSPAKFNKDGWEFTRGAIVQGLTASGDARESEAVQAVIDNGQSLGSAHPTKPLVYLDSIGVQSMKGSVAILSLVYKTGGGTSGRTEETPANTTIEVGATLVQKEVNTDAFGNLLKVTYKGREQGGTASAMVPQVTLSARRTEAQAPDDKAASYVGRVSAAGWRLSPGVAGAWLCTSIVGSSSDGMQTWDVSYTFQRDEDAEHPWWTQIVYTDPQTGRPPADVTVGNGIEWYRLYATADFNALNLA